MPDRVFLDTNVLHSSQVSLVVRAHGPKLFEYDGRQYEVDFRDLADLRLRDGLKGEVRDEADLLPRVAELAKKGVIELITSDEVEMEKWGLPWSWGRRTVMDGAKILRTDPPIEYSRVLMGPWDGTREYRAKFIQSFSDRRFLEIAKACGAFDGPSPKTNTLWDAFHVWWAEAAGARYFLTLDFKLIKRAANKGRGRPSVRLVRPSELIRAVTSGS
jgi:hypothetical protein